MGSQLKFIQNAFTSGELTPRLTARDDYDRYANGVKTMHNFFPLPHGGARTRYGSRFVGWMANDVEGILIPFLRPNGQAYLLVYNQILRVMKDGAWINTSTGTITGATNNGAGLVRLTSTAHGLSDANRIEVKGVLGTTEANGNWSITNVTANTFDLVGSAFVNAYTSGGTWNKPLTISHPWTQQTLAEQRKLRWAQHGDTLYFTTPSTTPNQHPPQKLVYTNDTTWTFTAFTGSTNFVDGPYQDENTDAAKTFTCAANTGTTTITATGHSPFTDSTWVGSLIRLKGNTTWGYVRLTSRVSDTVYNCVVVLTLDFVTPGTSQTSAWRYGSFSGKMGYPAAITIFEQRLAFAGTTTEPQTVWLSTTGSYEDFSPSAVNGTVAADDGITYRLGSNQSNTIQWLQGSRDLMIGTIGEEFSMKGAGDAALTPTNAPIVRSGSAYGSAIHQAIRAGSSVYFLQRAARKFRSLAFDFNTDTYLSPDISLSAEHLFRANTLVTPVYQLEPDSIVWLLRDDGKLLSFTLHELERVYGWAQHSVVGAIEAIAVIPATDGASDTLWAITKRTINGVTKRHIEYFDPTYDTDSSILYDGRLAATITPGATTGNGVTFTASAGVFTSADVGKDIVLLGHLVNGVKWYSRADIATFVSTTQVTANITADFPNTVAVPQNSWGLGVEAVAGVDHLEGQTVAIVGDGAVYDTQVVTGGRVDLEDNAIFGPGAVVVKIGLARTPNPKIETLQPAFRDEAGTVRNKWKHWATCEVDVESTLGLTINGATEIQYRKPSDPMDVAVPAFTGTKEVPLRHTKKDGMLTFEQTHPLPATLLSYYGELETGD